MSLNEILMINFLLFFYYRGPFDLLILDGWGDGLCCWKGGGNGGFCRGVGKRGGMLVKFVCAKMGLFCVMLFLVLARLRSLRLGGVVG